MTWGRGPSRLQFFKQKFNCAPAWQINDFQMTRKLFPSHKNPRLQLKKQNMAKFKTFSRSDISSLAVRWRTVPEQCSFFLEGAKMMLKQLKRIYAWKFTVLLFLLYIFHRVYFRYFTRCTQHTGKVTVDFWNSQYSTFVKLVWNSVW